MKKLWMIKTPFIFQNLLKLNDVKILIYELNKNNSSDMYAECYIYHIIENGSFIIKDTRDSFYIHKQKIYDEIIKNSGNLYISENIFFTSKELAYISSIFILKDFKEKFNKELDKIKLNFEEHMPNFDEHMKIINDKYLEYLI